MMRRVLRLTPRNNSQVFKHSSQDDYDKTLTLMKAQAPKLAAQQPIRKKRAVAQSAQNEAIWSETSNLSSFKGQRCDGGG